MTYLNFGNNQFTGCLDFRHLPLTLTSLSCNDNNFDTLAQFHGLPPKLEFIQLHINPELHGVLEKSSFPATLAWVDVSGTKLIIL